MDIHIFSEESLRTQILTAECKLGTYILTFYADEKGGLAKTVTDALETFYYMPSGGTIRDKNMNLVTYSARFDAYKDLAKGAR